MNGGSFLILSRHAPYSSSLARDALDLALTAAAFGQTVSLLFMDDGVYQLLGQQQPEVLDSKNLSNMLRALPMYDVEQVYVEEASLIARGLDQATLAIPATRLDSDATAKLLASHDQLLSF